MTFLLGDDYIVITASVISGVSIAFIRDVKPDVTNDVRFDVNKSKLHFKKKSC